MLAPRAGGVRAVRHRRPVPPVTASARAELVLRGGRSARGNRVATVRPVELAPDAVAITQRSRAERSKLRPELGRLDAICLLIAAIVVLDTLGAVARAGRRR